MKAKVPSSRKARRFVLIAGAIALLALALCACTEPGNQTTRADSGQETERSVTDAYGRTVHVPKEVETVATVGSGARFVVYAGGQDKLVAVTEMEYPAAPSRPYTVVHQDLFSTLPTTSNGNHLMETTVDTEKLLEINPDVIVSSRSAEECDALQESIGIPVVGISYQGQLFTENVYASIEAVGQAVGTEDHARQVVTKLKEWKEDLSERTASIPDDQKPRVYVGAVNFKGAKSFTGTYAHYPVLDAINAKNVADESGQKGAFDTTLEQIGTWDPDIMFLNAGNMELLKKDFGDNPAFFNELQAFKNKRLYSQPSFNFNGTNVEMGICDTYFCASVVYPDRFSDIDLPARYDEIFTVMLGSPYYDTMKSSGADFKPISIG